MENDYFDPRPAQPLSWADVHGIVGDVKDVSIERIKAGKIAWKYDFKDLGTCGRAGCHQQHLSGAVVALRGGGFINIGHCCATKYVGEAWERMLSDYEASANRSAHEKANAMALDEAQRKQYWLDENKGLIGDAISILASFRSQAGPRFLQEIERRAEKGRSVIEFERRLTPDEHEARCIALQRVDKPTVNVPWTETQRLGDIKGLSCFRPGRGPADACLKLQRLVTVLLTWASRDGDGEDTKLLQQQTRLLAPLTRDLEDSLRATRDFFLQANLDTMMNLQLMRYQGIQALERAGPREIRIHRRPGWNAKSAA